MNLRIYSWCVCVSNFNLLMLIWVLHICQQYYIYVHIPYIFNVDISICGNQSLIFSKLFARRDNQTQTNNLFPALSHTVKKKNYIPGCYSGMRMYREMASALYAFICDTKSKQIGIVGGYTESFPGYSCQDCCYVII